MTAENEERPAPENVNALLQRIDDSWRDLMQALDGIPEDRLEEPGACGDWSVKNLMGHLAFWDEIAVDKIDRALAGLPDEVGAYQSLNDADHAARLGRTLAEERTAMHQAHAAVIARLDDIGGIEAGPIDEAISPDTYDHYAEHILGILAWRQRLNV